MSSNLPTRSEPKKFEPERKMVVADWRREANRYLDQFDFPGTAAGKARRAESAVDLLGRSARDWWDHVHLKKDGIVAPKTSDEVFDSLAAEYTFVRHDNEVRDQLWGLRKADQEYLTDFFHLAAPTKIGLGLGLGLGLVSLVF